MKGTEVSIHFFSQNEPVFKLNFEAKAKKIYSVYHLSSMFQSGLDLQLLSKCEQESFTHHLVICSFRTTSCPQTVRGVTHTCSECGGFSRKKVPCEHWTFLVEREKKNFKKKKRKKARQPQYHGSRARDILRTRKVLLFFIVLKSTESLSARTDGGVCFQTMPHLHLHQMGLKFFLFFFPLC